MGPGAILGGVTRDIEAFRVGEKTNDYDDGLPEVDERRDPFISSEAAAELLQYWKLPENVVAAARWHHRPEDADPHHQQIVDVIHLADALAMRMGWGSGVDVGHYRIDEDAMLRVGLTRELAGEITAAADPEIRELREQYLVGPRAARERQPV